MAESDDKEQKTEEATPRRREEARDRGQVALSSELIAALGLCLGTAMLSLSGGRLAQTLGGLTRDTLGALGTIGTSELTAPSSARLIREPILAVLGILGVVVLPTVAFGALAGYLQVGFRIAPKAIELNPGKLNPVQGLQKLFSLRAVVRTVMAAAKVILISAVVSIIAWAHVDEIADLGVNDLGPLLAGLGHVALRCTAGALAIILALAVVDLFYQRYQLAKDLRMTKQEVKEEHRLTDGDPHVRARIRQIQREAAQRRMMDEVPDATVVVTNPTHYAVALRYEVDDPESKGAAPKVIAKGVDHIAQRIKAVAAEHGVVCYEDVPLARALHAQVEIGQEIPDDLYGAVATVLGYVYRLRGERVAS